MAGIGEVEVVVTVVVVVGGFFVEEGAGEVGEEEGVEVAEPEEGLLEGVAPVLGEEEGGVGGGGGVEGVVEGVEVLVEHLHVGGEDGGGVADDGAAEEREEVVLQGAEPLAVVVLEGTRVLVPVEQWRHRFQHLSFFFFFFFLGLGRLERENGKCGMGNFVLEMRERGWKRVLRVLRVGGFGF